MSSDRSQQTSQAVRSGIYEWLKLWRSQWGHIESSRLVQEADWSRWVPLGDGCSWGIRLVLLDDWCAQRIP